MQCNATYCCQGVTVAAVIDAIVAVIVVLVAVIVVVFVVVGGSFVVVVVVVVVARNPWILSWLNDKTDLQQGINDYLYVV